MSDILKLYFEEIKHNKGLDKAETARLAKAAQTGCKESIDKVIKNHLLLVVKIAREYIGKGVELSELIAEGNTGLVKAIEKWDSTKGASFTTCATWWIRQSIIRNCMHNNRIVRLPEHISELMRSERIDFRYSEVQIDKPNEDGNTLAETIPDSSHKIDIFILEEEDITNRTLNRFLGILKPKEREIIELFYGLNGREQRDTKQISELMSLTTTRINQILRSSMKKMQEQI
jgi:RNA polymerase nonessential primary-like sigma factor